MSKVRAGNTVFATLWRTEWFQQMKREWYDDPETRRMLAANGRQTMALLRQNPVYVAKITDLHRVRYQQLWSTCRDQMLGVAKMGHDAFMAKLQEPDFYAQMQQKWHAPERFEALVQDAAVALEHRKRVEDGRFSLEVVEALARSMQIEHPLDGLVEFAWRLKTQESYAKRLLAEACASKPNDVGLRTIAAQINGNVGAGPLVWRANVDVALVRRMHDANVNFTTAKLAILNPKPVRPSDVHAILGLGRDLLPKERAQRAGVTDAGIEILVNEFPHVSAERKAYACASRQGQDEIKTLLARFQRIPLAEAEDVIFELLDEMHSKGKEKLMRCKLCSTTFAASSKHHHAKGKRHIAAMKK
jgi:hypothetical protein